MDNRWTGTIAAGAAALALVATTAPTTASAEPGPTRLVSTSEQGAPGDAASHSPALSADGSVVAFESHASTLVPGDTNDTRDVFVRDLTTDGVERVSVDEAGNQLPGNSFLSSMSADGSLVMFEHLHLIQTGNRSRLERRTYVRDRRQTTSRLLEVKRPDGSPVVFSADQISGNGRFVTLITSEPLVRGDRNDRIDVYRYELATGRARLVSKGRPNTGFRECRFASISHSGRFVAFEFPARLAKRDRLNARDIYVRDMKKRWPTLVTVSSTGVQANRGSMAPAISAGGRYVVFSSYASNLVPQDTNGDWDVFLHDRRTDTTERVSVDSLGRQANAASGFWSAAAPVSRNGRFVVFGSSATDLDPVTDDAVRSNVFVRDRQEGTTRALSLAPDGSGADDDSAGGLVSADGSATTFWSDATNLVDGDVNATTDVFWRPLGDPS
jgi:Tol biopolymer transport system component